MKKSEAAKKIQDYLDKHSIYQIHPFEILRLVEDLGMYPPDREMQGHTVSEWEPE